MISRVIDIRIDVTHDLASNMKCIDAYIERERNTGAPFNLHEYEWVTMASFIRLQNAQRFLIERKQEER